MLTQARLFRGGDTRCPRSIRRNAPRRARARAYDPRDERGGDSMQVTGLIPILNVSDLAQSFAWFEAMGWRRLWEWGEPPTFAAVGCGKVEIFLCVGAQGSRGGAQPRHAGDGDTGGVWMSWFLDTPQEVDAARARALAAGFEITWPPTDEPWGVREFHLRHPDGHTFRVGAGLQPCD
jgi:catechol 2,3-dioxygenase-like lactoylglutathione lyase family enzyme